MKQKLLNNFRLRAVMLVAMMCAAFTGARAETKTDVLNQQWTDVSGTNYSAWSDKTATSDAVYAGNSAGGNSSIQLRSNNNNSGIVTTTSGGKVKSITVTWNSNTQSGRTLNVYGKNSAYSAPTDLYNSSSQGTLLGTIVCGTSTKLEIKSDYEYIGFRSASGAMYLDEVQIEWEVGGGDTPTLKDCDLALTGPTDLEFDLYNNADAQVINYTTSSTGAVTVASSEYINAEVSNGTITVTPLKKTSDAVVITVNQAADDNYKAGSTTFTVNITDSTPKTGAWVLTSLADLGQGDVFVIVGNNGSNYAMSNDNGTSSAPTAVKVTIENDEITSDVDDNIKWNIGGNATDGYTFYPNGDSEIWLYCTNANNGVRVGTNDNKTFVIDSNYLKHSATSRYVGVYNSSDWRCYTNTTGNIANQTFAFYKYVDNTTPKVLSSITLSGEYPTSFHVGDAFSHEGMAVTATYDNASTKDVTASATFSGYDMAAVGNQTVTVSYTENEVTKTAEYSITVNAPATLTSITLSGTYPTEFEQGDAFSSEGIVVTANFDDNTTSDVTASATFSGYDMSVIGEQTVTVTYEDKSSTYTINVAEKKGVENNPYTVAEARAAIDASTGTTGVYATGVISQVDSYNSNYNSITYWISEDGTTTSDQLEVYSGKGLNNTNFTSVNDVVVGATVVVYGTLKKYGDVYEFDKNNYLTSYSAPAVAVEAPTFSPIAGTYADAQNVTISCETANATIYYTTDGTEPTNQSTVYTSDIAVNADMTIKAIAYDVTGANSTVATATYHICSADNPYTVTQALAFSEYPANGVYVSGIVSTAPTQSPTNNGQLTYYISVNGEATNQLQVYKGLGLNEAAFNSQDDIQVGDEVTIYGNVKIYNNTKEFDTGNYLVAFNRPATPTITVSSTSLTGFTYLVDNGPSAAQQITIGGENLTKTWSAHLNDYENSNFEFSFIENEGYSSDGSLGSMQEPNQNVLIYVRLKSGLAAGDYDGAITISSEGAETVTVNLSGSVTAPEAPNVTWDLSTDQTATATTDEMSWTSNYATMVVSKDGAATNTNNYYPGTAGQSYTSTRFYKNSGLIITPALGYEITSIIFEATSANYASALASSTWTNASADANGTTVTVTPTDGSTDISATIGGTCGFTSAKVYYQVQAPSAPVWDELPTPEVSVGVEYELNLSDFVSGFPTPTISIETGGDIAQFENNVLSFTPTEGGSYEFTFSASNSVGSANATLTVTVIAAAASIEVSETTINIEADETTSYVIVPVTYTSFTPNGAHAQLYEADGVTPLQSNPYTWIMVGTDGTNFFYKINETNTSSEPRTVYCKILANDANNSPVYSDLITITQAGVAVPVVDYATLPFSFNGGKGDIESQTGLTHTGLGTDYSDKTAPTTRLKFDSANDELVLKLNEAPTMLTFDIKGNGFSDGTFTVQTSSDGEKYSDLETYTDLDETQSESFNLDENVRYIKWIYTNKVNGNVGLGNIIVTAPITVTLNAYGYATYASEYALDFTTAKAEGYSAWEITEVNYSTGTITFNQIKDKVAAGTGVLLMGDPSSEVTLTRTANGEALPDNKLVGITESTQVGDNQYFGLKSNEFVKVNTGVVPAGKALLPIDNPTAGVKSFTLIFNDADGIQTIETVSAEKAQAIFNLAGQRLPKAQKGINIINGKKVLVK